MAAEHVFAGDPDGRQSADPGLAPSRFRPVYRPLSQDEKSIRDDVKAAFAAAEEQIERIKAGRYRSLAMTALEEACMWAVKGLTE
jgi:hypothetical protein